MLHLTFKTKKQKKRGLLSSVDNFMVYTFLETLIYHAGIKKN